MNKAKQPVSINGIEFDALITEEKTLEAEVPEYAVEEGYAVSDTIILGALQLTMTLYVTNMPVTWKSRFGNSKNRVETVCKQLEELYYSGQPVKIVTSFDTYENMAITNITFTKDETGNYAREIPITFKQIIVTSAKKATIPDSYFRSGATGQAAGTAGTGEGNTGNGNNSGGNNANGNNNSGSGDETPGSILYNVGSNLGIVP